MVKKCILPYLTIFIKCGIRIVIVDFCTLNVV